MSKPKLTYFDFSGSRGEECRMALFLAGVDFEDHRLKPGEWPSLKPETPFGSLPILEIEGKPALGQSNAILAFVGRQHGLHPADPWDAARHEGVMEAVEDLRAAMTPLTKIEDEAEKKSSREAFAAGALRAWATHVEAQIRGPFVEGEKLHVADLKLFMITHSFVSGVYDHFPNDCLAAFPKLTALHDAVVAHPKVAAWRAR
jgi:prostaglandin-H2 D-isomerase / glutathione transferase